MRRGPGVLRRATMPSLTGSNVAAKDEIQGVLFLVLLVPGNQTFEKFDFPAHLPI